MTEIVSKLQTENNLIDQRSRELMAIFSQLSPEEKVELLDSLSTDIAHEQAVFETLKSAEPAGAERAIFNAGKFVLNRIADKLHLPDKPGVRFLG